MRRNPILLRISFTFWFTVVTMALSAQITFERWYGNPAGFEYALSSTLVSTGGYAVAMNSDSTPLGNTMDMVLVRTDINGNEVWRRYFGSNGWDVVNCIIETNDGGFAMCGSWNGMSADSGVVIKTDVNGTMEWITVFQAAPGKTFANKIIELQNGTFVVCGAAGQLSLEDGFLRKFSATGATMWQKILGGQGMDCYYSLEDVSGTGFIVAGVFTTSNDSSDFWLVRMDASGDTLWTGTYGSLVSEVAHDVIITQDGGFAMIGQDKLCNSNAIMVKTDASGGQQWIQMYDQGREEKGFSLVQTSDGGYGIAGGRDDSMNVPCMWLMRVDISGNYLWDRIFPSGELSEGYDIHITPDGGFLITGYEIDQSFGMYAQAYVVKTESAGWVSIAETNSSAPVFMFAQDVPNNSVMFSFSSALPGRILRITDIEGRTVREMQFEDSYLLCNISECATGTYVYSIYTANKILESGKFVKP